eukprot:TRINITY_DN6352_c0_g1_i3.p1 TRINITY_DN6352_c0_g1~~TRINITY_DN6352_c0_g1_i3.p1  ORF type:complete len:745 (-),score=107.03 TRINITY_DN6352_c0_g1_i3:133-2166(-)
MGTPYALKTFEPLPENVTDYSFTSGGYDCSVSSLTQSSLEVCPSSMIRASSDMYIIFMGPTYPTSVGMDVFATLEDCQIAYGIDLNVYINGDLSGQVSSGIQSFFGWAGVDEIISITISVNGVQSTPGMMNLLLATTSSPIDSDTFSTTSTLYQATTSALDHATTSAYKRATTTYTAFTTTFARNTATTTAAVHSATSQQAATSTALHSVLTTANSMAASSTSSTTGPPSPPLSYTCTFTSLLGYHYNFSALDLELYAYSGSYPFYFNPCGVSTECLGDNTIQSCVPTSSFIFALGNVNQQTITPPSTPDGPITIDYRGGSTEDGCDLGRYATVILQCNTEALYPIIGTVIESPSCHYTFTLTSMYACPVSGPDSLSSYQYATSTQAQSTSTQASYNSMSTSFNSLITSTLANMAATTDQALTTSQDAMSTTAYSATTSVNSVTTTMDNYAATSVNSVITMANYVTTSTANSAITTTNSAWSSTSDAYNSATTSAIMNSAATTTTGSPSPPSYTCEFTSPLGYNYDISPLDLELHTYTSPNTYYFNPCGVSSACGGNVQSCEVTNNYYWYIIGYTSEQTIIPASSYYGTTTFIYGGGSTVAGCDEGRTATVFLLCDPNADDPIVVPAVESPRCHYTFQLTSKYACPVSAPPPPLDSTSDTSSTSANGITAGGGGWSS